MADTYSQIILHIVFSVKNRKMYKMMNGEKNYINTLLGLSVIAIRN